MLALAGGERELELAARADVELGEHLVQVVLDGARADEQPRADLRVREPVAREPRDLRLLRGQLAARLDAALAGRLARGQQLARGPIRERLARPSREQLVRGAQLRARVEPAARRGAATRRRAGGRARGPAARACGRAARSPRDRAASASSPSRAARACAPRRPSAQSVPLAAVAVAQPLERGRAASRRPLRAAASTISTSALGYDRGRVVLAGALRGGQRLLVAAEPVVERWPRRTRRA